MSRFDRKIADEFLKAVRMGASNEVAAAYADVGLDRIRSWLRGTTKATASFRAEVDKARSDLEMLAVGHVRRNMQEDTAAAQWIAEKAKNETEFERLRELTT
jgi:head-tail adaptor